MKVGSILILLACSQCLSFAHTEMSGFMPGYLLSVPGFIDLTNKTPGKSVAGIKPNIRAGLLLPPTYSAMQNMVYNLTPVHVVCVYLLVLDFNLDNQAR